MANPTVSSVLSAFAAPVVEFISDIKPNWAESADYKPEVLKPKGVEFAADFANGIKPMVNHGGKVYACPIWDNDATAREVDGKQTIMSVRRQTNRKNWYEFRELQQNESLEAALKAFKLTLKIEVLTKAPTSSAKVGDLRYMITCARK